MIVVNQKQVRLLPEEIDYQKGAALPAVYVTAYHCLKEVLRVEKDEDILIQAVAGGVGIAALQLAKHFGLTTYGTAGTDEKVSFAMTYGLDYGINYCKKDFEKEIGRLTRNKGVKFLLDSLGGYTLRKGVRCLKPGGHAVTIGGAGVLPPIGIRPSNLRGWVRILIDLIQGGVYHPFSLIEGNISLSGAQILLLWDNMDYLGTIIDTLLVLQQKQVIHPYIDRIFALDEVAQAHQFIEERKSRGKILLATDPA